MKRENHVTPGVRAEGHLWMKGVGAEEKRPDLEE